MLEKLFKFPIAMIDGDEKEKKAERAKDLALAEEELDIIIGEAECPHYDFMCISDRWLPTSESLQNAMDGNFDACLVVFSHSGSFLVPWNKEKFKRELNKFRDTIPKEEPVQFSVIDLSKFKEKDSEE